MKRLILTGSGIRLAHSGLAEAVIEFRFRFVWGPLPPVEEFEDYFGARSGQGPGRHWSDWCSWRLFSDDVRARRHLSLVEYCEPYDVIELWFEQYPNDQLQLVFLLAFFRCHPETAARLKLRLVDFDLTMPPERMPEPEDVLTVDVGPVELNTGSAIWSAYRAASPMPFLDCLQSDLSSLPFLRSAQLALVAELPSRATGLGATEMRLLELIARYDGFSALGLLHRFWHPGNVFGELELFSLLDGLADGPSPAVTDLERPQSKRSWHARYAASYPRLTEFGEAIIAHREDFSSPNPIDRWWGGTHLTNDNLWRIAPTLTRP